MTTQALINANPRQRPEINRPSKGNTLNTMLQPRTNHKNCKTNPIFSSPTPAKSTIDEKPPEQNKANLQR